MTSTSAFFSNLNPTPEQAEKLGKILEVFGAACNYVNQTVNSRIKNENRIQAEVYKECVGTRLQTTLAEQVKSAKFVTELAENLRQNGIEVKFRNNPETGLSRRIMLFKEMLNPRVLPFALRPCRGCASLWGIFGQVVP